MVQRAPELIGTFTTGDGTRLSFRSEGEGPDLILLHGAGSSTEANWVQTGWWQQLTTRFSVVGLDLRGHGASDEPGSAGTGWRAVAQDVVDLGEHLRLRRFGLLGYSAGSGTALRAASILSDRVAAVAAGGTGVGGLALAGLAAPSGTAETRAALECLVDLLASLGGTGAAASRLIAAQVDEGFEDDIGVMPPTLLFTGRSDTVQEQYAAVACSEWLAELIPGAQRYVLPGDHMSTLTEEATRRAVLDWLGSHVVEGRWR